MGKKEKKEKKGFFSSSRIKVADAGNGESSKPISDKGDMQAVEPTVAISKKKRALMKGASQLDTAEKKFYDTKVVLDPSARASKKMGKAGGNLRSPSGDGDVWIEKIFRNRETGETKIFFVSKNTGRKVQQEPPTGASNIMYLRASYKDQNSSPPNSPGGKNQRKSSPPNSRGGKDKRKSSPPNSPDGKDKGKLSPPISHGSKDEENAHFPSLPSNTSGSDSSDTDSMRRKRCVPCMILEDQTIPTDRPI